MGVDMDEVRGIGHKDVHVCGQGRGLGHVAWGWLSNHSIKKLKYLILQIGSEIIDTNLVEAIISPRISHLLMLDNQASLLHLGGIQNVVDQLQKTLSRHLDGGNCFIRLGMQR